jgi:hypothetical protein
MEDVAGATVLMGIKVYTVGWKLEVPFIVTISHKQG